MRRSLAVSGLCGLFLYGSAGYAAGQSPSIDDLINLKRVGSPVISPDGRRVAFTVRETNWDENAYETELWLGDAAGPARQLTNARKSSTQPAWSPDGAWLAFISDRDGKRQLYRIAIAGGEAEKLTSTEDGIGNFAWSPKGDQVAFTTPDAVTDAMKEREKQWGDLRIEDEDQRYSHLHVLDLASKAFTRLTQGSFMVGAFDWSPDGTRLAFDHRITSDPADGGSADISVVTVATGAREAIVTQAGPDSNPQWSPDGSQIAFSSAMSKPFYFYQNGEVAVVTPGKNDIRSLTDGFDESPGLVAWTRAGIFISASQRTWSYLFHLDPVTKKTTKHAVRDHWIGNSFSLTPDGSAVAFIGSGPTDFPDVYIAPVKTMVATKISDTAAQIGSWPKNARETIRWKSQDGAEIEGVLHKPADFQAGRRYPLLVVIHGGPTGVSRPVPYAQVGYYPVDAFLAKGALVFEPNYRGSAGGLRDQNVPVQLAIFKGFGHGLNKPKANRGAMQQNLDWFSKYIWGATTGTQR